MKCVKGPSQSRDEICYHQTTVDITPEISQNDRILGHSL